MKVLSEAEASVRTSPKASTQLEESTYMQPLLSLCHKNIQQKMGRRIVVFPLPAEGHQNTILSLANVLHSKGFSITVISTRYHSPNTAKYPHLSFHMIDDGLTESEVSKLKGLQVLEFFNNECEVPFRECLSRILSASDEEPVACLIADAMWHFGHAVAESFNLPRITMKTGNISVFTVYLALPTLKEKGYFARRDEQPEDLIPELPPFRVKDIPGSPIKSDPSVAHEFLSKVVRECMSSKGVVINSFEELEDRALYIMQQQCNTPTFPCGPFHKWFSSSSSTTLSEQDQLCLSWLDKQAPNSVLYVSFGTVASINKAMFLEVAWGLANSKQPFLLVVRSGLVSSSDGSKSNQLPDDFLQEVSGRCHIVDWAQQKSVLAHPAVGGFWTHNGWNSTLESICEGVPMICSPCFGDQMVNARCVSDIWNIGLQLEMGAKREDVEKTIRKLMVEEEGEEMRKRAACLKDKAKNCLLPGGSSYKYMEDLVNLILSF